MRTLLRFIKMVVTITTVALILGTVGIGAVYFYFAHDLPHIQSFEDYKPPIVSEVYADNGEKMGEFWIERRLIVKYDDVPKLVVRAFVSAEDARFFEHGGVDVRGIGRAFYENLKAGQVVQGGSTITQQVTRSILLSRERSYTRKIKEAILATRIDRTLSKKEIMEIYLNQIFLGNRAYGVKAAAENYFHKDLDTLTIAEAAMIAGLTQGPSTDNPIVSAENAKERQLYVLKRMNDLGYISNDEMKKAVDEPLTVYAAGIDKDFNNKYAPYFTEHVRRMILEQYGDKVVYEGGLKIYTTANIKMNQAAQKAVKHGLEALDHRRGYRGSAKHLTADQIPAFLEKEHKKALDDKYGAVIHIPETDEDRVKKLGSTPLDPEKFYEAVVVGFSENGRDIKVKVGHNDGTITHSGYQWAWGYMGGRPSHKLSEGDIVLIQATKTGNEYNLVQVPKVQGALFSMIPQTGFVKAMSGGYDFMLSEFNRSTQALRQPGSSFKPIVYSSAMDKGYTYSHIVVDSPVAYKVGDEIWMPKNYGNKFSGPTTFESNLVNSRNVPTVKIADSVGTHYITGYARKLGLTNQFYKYLSMALGANSVYLEEMVTAYSTIANHGKKPDRIFITKVNDSEGKILQQYIPPSETLSPSAAQIWAKNMNPDSTELNTTLFEENKQYIETDNLQLSEEEMRVLYGKAIPHGYVMTPQTAYLMCNLMQEVVKRGTGARVGRELGRPAAGKTGTTNDETDAWFIGFVPDLATGAWVGHDVKKSLGRGEQGGRTAAPIFIEYMKDVLEGTEIKEFSPPESFSIDQIALIKGGSAIYSTGFAKAEAAWFGVSHDVVDRAVDFFEEDMGF